MWAQLEEKMNANSIKNNTTALINQDVSYVPEKLTQEM